MSVLIPLIIVAKTMKISDIMAQILMEYLQNSSPNRYNYADPFCMNLNIEVSGYENQFFEGTVSGFRLSSEFLSIKWQATLKPLACTSHLTRLSYRELSAPKPSRSVAPRNIGML
jgi:hypothetical protein